MSGFIDVLRFKDHGQVERIVSARLGRALSAGTRCVLVKPNWLAALPAERGATTDVALVGAVVRAIRTLGIPRVIVAEGAIDRTAEVFEELNVARLRDDGAEIIDLEQQIFVLYEVPGAILLRHIMLPAMLQEVDAVVTMPKVKTHALTRVTLGVKNFFGFLNRAGRRAAHKTDIGQAIADLYGYFWQRHRLFAVVDGVRAMDGGGGPVAGRPVDLGAVLVSDDPLQCDELIVRRLMGADPAAVPHLWATRAGGWSRPEPAVSGGDFDLSRSPQFDIPPGGAGHDRWLAPLRGLFRVTPWLAAPQHCVKCHACLRVCPVGAVSDPGTITFDLTSCIGCLCCFEACAAHAIDYRRRNAGLHRLLSKYTNH